MNTEKKNTVQHFNKDSKMTGYDWLKLLCEVTHISAYIRQKKLLLVQHTSFVQISQITTIPTLWPTQRHNQCSKVLTPYSFHEV
jgi:hypothetical protein